MPAMSTKPVKPFKPAKRAAPASPTGLTRLTKQAKLTAPTAPTVLAVCQLVTWHNNAGLAKLANDTTNTHNTLIPIRLYQIERITKPIKVNMRLLAWMDTPSSAYQFMCL